MPTTLVNTNTAAGSPPSDNMRHGQNYSFYLRKQSMTDPPLMYANLIASATSGIIIWDAYIETYNQAVSDGCQYNLQNLL